MYICVCVCVCMYVILYVIHCCLFQVWLIGHLKMTLMRCWWFENSSVTSPCTVKILPQSDSAMILGVSSFCLPFIHPICPSICWFICQSLYSLIHPFIYLPILHIMLLAGSPSIHRSISPSVCSFVWSSISFSFFNHSFIHHSSNHQSNPSILPAIHSSICPSIILQPLIHPSIQPFILLVNTSIWLFIHVCVWSEPPQKKPMLNFSYFQKHNLKIS